MKKFLTCLMIVFTFALAGVFYGCGDPYKNTKITIQSGEVINLTIDTLGNKSDATVSVKVSGTPKNSSKELTDISVDKGDVASIDKSTIVYNAETGVTEFKIIAEKGGRAELVLRAEGGKTKKVEIYVQERLRSINFVSTYKPAIILGETFTVEKYGIVFTPASATNLNIKKYTLFRKVGESLIEVKEAIFKDGVLSKEITAKLSTEETYLLRAVSDDGAKIADAPIVVVRRINLDAIKLKLAEGDYIDKITLATNIESLSKKTFEVEVQGYTSGSNSTNVGLKIQIVSEQNQQIYNIDNDLSNQARFTISKQNRGKSSVTIRVGYQNSFDFYSVNKVIDVEIYEEPIGIEINNKQDSSINIFSSAGEWQRLFLTVIPVSTNFKDIQLIIPKSEMFDKNNNAKFKFALLYAGNYNPIIFTEVGENLTVNLASGVSVYVAKADGLVEGQECNITIKSMRNDSALQTKLVARNQIEEFNVESSSGVDDVDINGSVETVIGAPNGSRFSINYKYESGFDEIYFTFDSELASISNHQKSIDTKSGSFDIYGLKQGETFLNVMNGDKVLKRYRVFIFNPVTVNTLKIRPNDSQSIIKVDDNNFVNEIYFNNYPSANAISINFLENGNIIDTKSSGILFKYRNNIEAVGDNLIYYDENTGVITVQNKNKVAEATLTFEFFYYESNISGTDFRLIKTNHNIILHYSPELLENMVGFKKDGQEVLYLNLEDYTTLGEAAETRSIANIEIFVKNTGYINIDEIKFFINDNNSENVFIKKISSVQDNENTYKYQILVGNIKQTNSLVNVKFEVKSNEKVITKTLPIYIKKNASINDFEIIKTEGMDETIDGLTLQLLNNGNTSQIIAYETGKPVTETKRNIISNLMVEVVNKSTELLVPITISNDGLVTRHSVGEATINIYLPTRKIINPLAWQNDNENFYDKTNLQPKVINVVCPGTENGIIVNEQISNESQLSRIMSNPSGNFKLTNNIYVSRGYKFNVPKFTGTIDGNNKSIYGLNQNFAMFDEVADGARISNLFILDYNQTFNTFVNGGVFALLTLKNYGEINNVEVHGKVTLGVNYNGNFTYGAIAGENATKSEILIDEENPDGYTKVTTGQINLSSYSTITFDANKNINAKINVGGVTGINYGNIDGNLDNLNIADNLAAKELVFLNVINMSDNLNVSNFGAIAAVNNANISKISGNTKIVLSANSDKINAGGISGTAKNATFVNVVGNLSTNYKILSAGGISGEADLTTLDGACGKVPVTVNGVYAFSAINAGGLVGYLITDSSISNSQVAGFVEAGLTPPLVIGSKIAGDNVGGFVGKSHYIEVNNSEINNIALTQLDTTNGSIGKYVGDIASTLTGYKSLLYFQVGQQAYDLTNVIGLDANKVISSTGENAIYSYVDEEEGLQEEQLYYDLSLPIMIYDTDENGNTVGKLDEDLITISDLYQVSEVGASVRYNDGILFYIVNGEEYRLIIKDRELDADGITTNLNTYYEHEEVIEDGSTQVIVTNVIVKLNTVANGEGLNNKNVTSTNGIYYLEDGREITQHIHKKYGFKEAIVYNEPAYGANYIPEVSTLSNVRNNIRNVTENFGKIGTAYIGGTDVVLTPNLTENNEVMTAMNISTSKVFFNESFGNDFSKRYINGTYLNNNKAKILQIGLAVSGSDTIDLSKAFIGVYGLEKNTVENIVTIETFDLSKMLKDARDFVFSTDSDFASVSGNYLNVYGEGTIIINCLNSSSQVESQVELNVLSISEPIVVNNPSFKMSIENEISIGVGSQFDFYILNSDGTVIDTTSGNIDITSNNNELIIKNIDAGRFSLSSNVEGQYTVNIRVNMADKTGKVSEGFLIFEKEIKVNILPAVNKIEQNISQAEMTKNDEIILTTTFYFNGAVPTETDVLKLLLGTFDRATNSYVGGKFSIVLDGLNPDYMPTLNVNYIEGSLIINGNLVTLKHAIYFTDLDRKVSQKTEYKLKSQHGDNLSNTISFYLKPEKINNVSGYFNPVSSDPTLIADVMIDHSTGVFYATPSNIFNDENQIKLNLSVVKSDGTPFEGYERFVSSLEYPKFVTKQTNGTFKFNLGIKLNSDASPEIAKQMRIKLSVYFCFNGNDVDEVTNYSKHTDFIFQVEKLPVIDLSFNHYYAQNTDRELILTDENGKTYDISDESFKKIFAGFKIGLWNDTQNLYSFEGNYYSEITNEYFSAGELFKIYSKNNKYYLTSKSDVKINTKFIIQVVAKSSVNNINNQFLTLPTSSVTGEVVVFSIDNIRLNTDSGRQNIANEIKIQFKVDASYSTNNKQIAEDEINAITRLLTMGWFTQDIGSGQLQFGEMLYEKDTQNFATIHPTDNQSTEHDKITHGGKFLIMPRREVSDNIIGYSIWGLSLEEKDTTIVLNTKIRYENGKPQILNYANTETNLSDKIIDLRSEFNFNFYQIATEENPIAISSSDAFISMLSSANVDNTKNTHYRLVNNIYLYDYEAIDANFASLDGNGYVIYIGSFKYSKTVEQNTSINMGLFKEIKTGTLVKNLSIAINGLNKFDKNDNSNPQASGAELDLTSYATVNFGFITPLNNGYIANCEVVSFDLSIKNNDTDKVAALETSNVSLKTNNSATAVVGGLVAVNNGSIVNSRVGRSVHSDYEYFGFGLIGGMTAGRTSSSDFNSEYNRLTTKSSQTRNFIANGINLTASGTIGGIAGINNGIVSSSYFAGGAITNNMSIVETSFTGGLVAINKGNILLSAVEGRFSLDQQTNKDAELVIKEGSIISSSGNVGGFVHINEGTISDSYSNIKLSTNARSAGFVFNTEFGHVRNSYAFTKSEMTTNNAPFVGLNPFETLYKGDVENCYYYKPGAEVSAPSDKLDNSDLLIAVTESFVLAKTTYTSFAFSQINDSDNSTKNGVWEFDARFGPLLSSAHSIATMSNILKREAIDNEIKPGSGIEIPAFGYISRDTGYSDYIFIKNAAEFNDRILNGEKEYVDKLNSLNKNASKKVYRLISNIEFGTSESETIGTSRLNFQGNFDGNGLSINNLEIAAEEQNNMIGMFASLTNGASIKNINVNVKSISASKTKVVGAIAGLIENSYAYNINLKPTTESGVSGEFLVGGAFGVAAGKNVQLSNITSELNITATNIRTGSITNKTDVSIYQGFGNSEITKQASYESISNYDYKGTSIAAGIVAVVDLAKSETSGGAGIDLNVISATTPIEKAQFKSLNAGGEKFKLTGISTGGVFGYFGANAFAHDIMFTANAYTGTAGTQKLGATIAAGAISVVNKGRLNYSRVEHANQAELDKKFFAVETQGTQNSINNLFSFTRVQSSSGNLPNVYAGGLAAINENGIITDSFVKVDVKPTVSGNIIENSYAGLIAGKTVGGIINYVYTLADVKAGSAAGGLFGRAEILKQKINGVDSTVKVTVNTASILFPVAPTLSVTNGFYDKFAAIAGSIDDLDVFKINNKSTLTNVIYTGIVKTTGTSGDVNVAQAITKNGDKINNLKNTATREDEEEKPLVTSDLFSELLIKRARYTFINFTISLRWNVYAASEKLPFPFYGISDTILYLEKSEDFSKIKTNPEANFIISPSRDNTIVIDDNILNLLNSVDFKGVMLGNKKTDKNPTIVINLTANANALINTLINAYIKDIDFRVNGVNDASIGSVLAKNSTGSTIDNVNIALNIDDGKSISSSQENFGLLIGTAENSLIQNCTVSGASNTIHLGSSNKTFGGLVGKMNGTTIINCNVSNLKVLNNSSSSIFGGLVGVVDENSMNSNISNSFTNNIVAEGVLTGGGFIGSMNGGSVVNSYSESGSLAGNEFGIKAKNNAGGFIGLATAGKIEFCFTDVSVQSGSDAGGFVSIVSNAKISKCYARGNVSSANAGGFVSQVDKMSNTNAIVGSYCTGDVTGTKFAGGFAYDLKGKVNNSYTLSRVGGTAEAGYFNYSGVGGVSDGSANNYAPYELNFKIDKENKAYDKNVVSIQKFVDGDLYDKSNNYFLYNTVNEANANKILQIYHITGGNEKFKQYQINNNRVSPNIIKSSKELKALSGKNTFNIFDANKIIIDDYTSIDFSGILVGAKLSNTTYSHIITNKPIFETLSNAVIVNLNISTQSETTEVETQSLLAKKAISSGIYKVSTSGLMSATGDNIGAIVGELNNSLLADSKNNANINVKGNNIGGLVGLVDNSNIFNCYNAGKVTGVNNVGGLVGSVDNGTASTIAKLDNVYNIGKVTGEDNIAGLVANIGSVAHNATLTLSNAYNTALITSNSLSNGIVGGFVAIINGKLNITNGYNSGACKTASGKVVNINAISPLNQTTARNVYYNSDLFPQIDSTKQAGVGKSTIEIIDAKTKAPMGESFVYTLENQFDMPMLKNIGGHETVAVGGQSDGYGANLKIVNQKEWNDNQKNLKDKNLILTVDMINNQGLNAFTETFTGTFYGNNKNVFNKIFSLFSKCDGATICNVNLMGSLIKNPSDGSSSDSGNMAASVAHQFDNGFISNIMFSGILSSIQIGEGENLKLYAGGVVALSNNSEINNCTIVETDIYQYLNSTSSEITDLYMGGIVGSAKNTIVRNSTFTGNIYAGSSYNKNVIGLNNVKNYQLGGLAGHSEASLYTANNLQNKIYVEGKDGLESGKPVALVGSVGRFIGNAASDSISSTKYQVKLQPGLKDIGAGNATVSGSSTTSTLIDFSKYNGFGTGSVGSPILINSKEKLKTLNKDLHYKLTGDISGGSESLTSRFVVPKMLDGRGFTISDFKIDGQSLFVDVPSGSVLKNFILQNIKVSKNVEGANYGETGLLTITNNGRIEGIGVQECTVDVTNISKGVDISTLNYGNVSGFVVNNKGLITTCYSTTQITILGAYNGTVTGFVYWNDIKATIKNSYVSSVISVPFKADDNGTANASAYPAIYRGAGTIEELYYNDNLSGNMFKFGGNALTEQALSNKVINGFSIVTVNKNGSSRNYGLPVLKESKNFNEYINYSFNITGRTTQNFTGTEIKDINGLKNMANDSTYSLTNNINFGNEVDKNVYDSLENTTIYGNGYIISGLNIDKNGKNYTQIINDSTGFIGEMTNCNISNLTFTNAKVSSSFTGSKFANMYVGTLAGRTVSVAGKESNIENVNVLGGYVLANNGVNYVVSGNGTSTKNYDNWWFKYSITRTGYTQYVNSNTYVGGITGYVGSLDNLKNCASSISIYGKPSSATGGKAYCTGKDDTTYWWDGNFITYFVAGNYIGGNSTAGNLYIGDICGDNENTTKNVTNNVGYNLITALAGSAYGGEVLGSISSGGKKSHELDLGYVQSGSATGSKISLYVKAGTTKTTVIDKQDYRYIASDSSLSKYTTKKQGPFYGKNRHGKLTPAKVTKNGETAIDLGESPIYF